MQTLPSGNTFGCLRGSRRGRPEQRGVTMVASALGTAGAAPSAAPVRQLSSQHSPTCLFAALAPPPAGQLATRHAALPHARATHALTTSLT